tara:strand:+ start:663 stop:845 length:183 start_codon:yes stop_codon:yes gene_type:complete
MMSKDNQYFHVYKKKTDQTIVIAHNLTIDQLEEKLKDGSVDLREHEVQQVSDSSDPDASF